jgi:hypothetical protein
VPAAQLIKAADAVRQYVLTQYIRPARERGDRDVSVTAGEVHKALGLKNRIPLVCAALRSARFQAANHLSLKDVTGPPSGMSTTVKFTFEILSSASGRGAAAVNPLWNLRGIAKGVFEQPSEWEDTVKQERAQLSDIQDTIGQ